MKFYLQLTLFLLKYDVFLEKEMATHSSTLAWEIPWTEDSGGYSPWGHKELGMTGRLNNNDVFQCTQPLDPEE